MSNASLQGAALPLRTLIPRDPLTIVGDDTSELLSGGFGNDTIYGNGGDDYLSSGPFHGYGSDVLYGGSGNDTLYAGLGGDTLYGGEGNDVFQGAKGFWVAFDTDADITVSKQGYGPQDTGQGIDQINGRFYNIMTGGGNDLLRGRNAYRHSDILVSGAGNDTIYGNKGGDQLYGGTGEDVLVGGQGGDLIDGGVDSDRDVFVFGNTSGNDLVRNFVSGQDMIDLHRMDASQRTWWDNHALAGNQAFVWSGAGPAANAIWTVQTGNDLTIYGDVYGDLTADFSIRLEGVTTISLTDIWL